MGSIFFHGVSFRCAKEEFSGHLLGVLGTEHLLLMVVPNKLRLESVSWQRRNLLIIIAMSIERPIG
jgi:hypothetical protein